MRRLLVALCALSIATSVSAQNPPSSAATPAAGGQAAGKLGDADLVTLDENGEPKYKLGFGGRKWQGTDPRKAAKAEAAKAAAAKTAGASAGKPAPAATGAGAGAGTAKKGLRSDNKLTSDSSVARNKREAEEKARAEEAKAAKASAAASSGGAPMPPMPGSASGGGAPMPSAR